MSVQRIHLLMLLLLVMSRAGYGDEPLKAQAAPLPILQLPNAGVDPMAIDYAELPTLKGRHAIVNQAALGPHARTPDKVDMGDLRLNLHNYLVHHNGRFWCIWSDGPKVEDWPTQEVKYSTSDDGLTWSAAKSVTGTPEEPYAFIARGLWVRDGQLLALAAHYREKGAFGAQEQKQLELVAYRYNDDKQAWELHGRLYDNAINNFPPQKLASGDWILTRRDSRFNVSVLIGGRKALDDWQAFPVVRIGEVPGFRPDEPIFWPLPGGALYALFRDNGGSQRLFHSTSDDEGRSWSTPVLTNFPNSSSKLFSMQTSRGYRVLVLNANPNIGRRELHLAVSSDGRTFTRLARLDVPSPPSVPQDVSRIEKKFSAGIASLQYPHVIEHDGRLLIALSRGKVQTEVFHVDLDDIDAMLEK
ncbi:MAG: sialidase family protein [Pirellulaceae bacterium]